MALISDIEVTLDAILPNLRRNEHENKEEWFHLS